MGPTLAASTTVKDGQTSYHTCISFASTKMAATTERQQLELNNGHGQCQMIQLTQAYAAYTNLCSLHKLMQSYDDMAA